MRPFGAPSQLNRRTCTLQGLRSKASQGCQIPNFVILTLHDASRVGDQENIACLVEVLDHLDVLTGAPVVEVLLEVLYDVISPVCLVFWLTWDGFHFEIL